MATRTTSSYVSPASKQSVGRLFAKARALYDTDGDFMKGIEAQLGRGRKRAVASGMQGLAAAGLAGTSMMGGIGKKYEEEVAQPMLAQAQSARLSALSGLLTAEAGAEASLATRYTTTPQAPTSPWAIPRRTSAQPSTVRRQTSASLNAAKSGGTAQQLLKQHQDKLRARETAKKKTALPSLNIGPSLPDPAGTWQATIGGTSFYSGGAGRRPTTQGAPTGPLGSYYKGL